MNGTRRIPRKRVESVAFVVSGGAAMAAAGPVTLGCDACGARYDLPLQATLGPARNGAVALAVTIDPPEVVLLKVWATAHRGPLVTA